MPAKASISPFNSSNWYKADTKLNTSTGTGVFWDLGGFHYRRQTGWTKRPKKGTRAYAVPAVRADGTIVKIYKSEGYDDYIGFHAHTNGGVGVEKAMAYAEDAFSKDSTDKILEVPGVGHIAYLKWAKKHQVMEVTFADGTITYFFKVPSAVFGTLYSIALKGEIFKPGSNKHHLLGAIFWELVRIKGQRHGARYPFEYKRHAIYSLTGSNKRYFVRLNDELARLLGVSKALKPGTLVSTVLTEEQLLSIPESSRPSVLTDFYSATSNSDDNSNHKDEASGGNRAPDIDSISKDDVTEWRNREQADIDERLSGALETFNNIMDFAKRSNWSLNKIKDTMREYGLPEEMLNGYRPTGPNPVDNKAVMHEKGESLRVPSAVNRTGLQTPEETARQKEIEDFVNSNIAQAKAKIEGKLAEYIKQNPDEFRAYENAENDAIANMVMRNMIKKAGLAEYYRGTDWHKPDIEKKDVNKRSDLYWNNLGDWVVKNKFSKPRDKLTRKDFARLEDWQEYTSLLRKRDPRSQLNTTFGRGWTKSDLEMQKSSDKMSDENRRIFSRLFDEGKYTDCLNLLKNADRHITTKNSLKHTVEISTDGKMALPNDFLDFDEE